MILFDYVFEAEIALRQNDAIEEKKPAVWENKL
jgi:hypothetical protein